MIHSFCCTLSQTTINLLLVQFVSRTAIFVVVAGLSLCASAADYLAQIKPIFSEHCYRCHGASQQKGSLRMDTAESIRKGGSSGPGLVAGKASESLIVQAIKGTHEEISRMPYKKPPLADTQIAAIEAWINAGATAPSNEAPQSSVHWSFIAPKRAELPELTNPAKARNAIDRFVFARLEKESIEPAPEADRPTLLRRLSLDITGLPPTPAEIEAFVNDSRPEAYEREVERLLASAHYGERWGRWWLDVARYGDSNGYSIDSPRQIWKYRDWVIEAINADMPFDQFTIEQLAGDLLPEATLEQKIATGFNRNTQINQEGGIDPEQFRVESVMDRVNTYGTAFLGLTVACAQCHDHKFDAISQKEYYQLFAFFNSTEEDGHGKSAPGSMLEIPGELQTAPPPKKGKEQKPRPVTTLVMKELEKPRDTFLLTKGDFTRPADRVYPGVLGALHKPAGTLSNRLDLARWTVDPANPLMARVVVNRIWQQYFGRGLVETENDFGTQGSLPTHPELLDWLACEFMQPSSGESRPWSLKHIHRLIVNSATYKQSSKVRPELAVADPNNRLLARQSRLRLDAEIVRDVGLSVSGLLAPELGGPPVYPPQPDGVMSLGQVKREWKASTGGERHRRAIYTHLWRATPHPALAVFDAPDGFSTCTRRIRSNTPLQALTLLNDQQFYEMAEALSERIQECGENDAEKVKHAFQLCLGREPRKGETERLLALIREEKEKPWLMLARVLLNLDETITRE